MSYLDYIKMMKINDGGESFANSFIQSCINSNNREQEWVKSLREHGIKASHPDDGWVDRERNIITLVYPQFNGIISKGDYIAIGDYSKFRIVRISDERKTLFHSDFKSYFFEDPSETDLMKLYVKLLPNHPNRK